MLRKGLEIQGVKENQWQILAYVLNKMEMTLRLSWETHQLQAEMLSNLEEAHLFAMMVKLIHKFERDAISSTNTLKVASASDIAEGTVINPNTSNSDNFWIKSCLQKSSDVLVLLYSPSSC